MTVHLRPGRQTRPDTYLWVRHAVRNVGDVGEFVVLHGDRKHPDEYTGLFLYKHKGRRAFSLTHSFVAPWSEIVPGTETMTKGEALDEARRILGVSEGSDGTFLEL